MTPETYTHQFPNGLTLLAERMPHVRSATMYLMVPAGFTREPADKAGASPTRGRTSDPRGRQASTAANWR